MNPSTTDSAKQKGENPEFSCKDNHMVLTLSSREQPNISITTSCPDGSIEKRLGQITSAHKLHKKVQIWQAKDGSAVDRHQIAVTLIRNEITVIS